MSNPNRKARREAARKSHRENPLGPDMWSSSPGGYAQYKRPPDPPPFVPVPGVDIPPIDEQFSEMVSKNIWFHKEAFQMVVDTIKELAVDHWAARDKDAPIIIPIGDKDPDADKPQRWSWAYNPGCKYVNLRIDMRDGGFVMTNQNGERINLEQLKWQWKKD